MSSEWTAATIGDLVRHGQATVQTGPFGSQLHSHDYVSSGTAVIPTEAIGRGRILDIPVPQVNSAKATELARHRLRCNDILFARRGAQATGLSAIVDEKFEGALCGTGALLLRVQSPNVDPKYLSMFLSSEAAYVWLRTHAVGAVMPNLNTDIIKALPILLPGIEEQRNLARFVGAIDDRITLFRETNATLEAIAHALFTSWFVNFDPVRAKMNGCVPEGMDETTAALFPDGFEESELGLVPRGWGVSTLDKHTSYLSRGISPKYIDNGGITVINQKCIRDFTLDLSKARLHDPAQRKIDGRELRKGDILVNSTGVGTLGRVAQVLSLDKPAIVDSHVTVMRAAASITWNYLGLSIMRRQGEIEGMGEGSTGQTELSRGKLAILSLLIPPASVLKNFDDVALPLRERFAANLKQAQTLATLRDTLLPRLISGQLRLPEAEAQIEALAA
jgi:type I restriction enzyme S subunit